MVQTQEEAHTRHPSNQRGADAIDRGRKLNKQSEIDGGNTPGEECTVGLKRFWDGVAPEALPSSMATRLDSSSLMPLYMSHRAAAGGESQENP